MTEVLKPGSSEPPENIYLPHLAAIKEIREETQDIKTFKLVFQDEELRKSFTYKPGQFIEFSIFGVGESPFCLASSPTREGYIECSIKKMGKVTQAIHDLEEGDIVGIRGPYGNGFPVEEMKGKNLIFVGGGIGLAPLRSLIWNVIDRRDDFKDVIIVYGSRSIADLVYKDELKQWQNTPGVKLTLTVDPGGEAEDWKGEIGFVPTILEKVNPSPGNSLVITCGPPIMIKFVLVTLNKMNFSSQQIITTLERKMTCGLGKCGRCNIGSVYVCKDGPVFTYAQIEQFQEEI
ncbi:MAG: heterodisulfide reductase subunit F [Nitrospirae bacterium]|nr:heterodisulfide reductase subunit F [Nitrospirota bacterium]